MDLRKKRVEKKLTEDELKVLAENELEFTKYVPPNDVQLLKQVPLHPRGRLKRTHAAKMKKNNNNISTYTSQGKAKTKS